MAVFGKKSIGGLEDAYKRGARAAGVITLMNDLAQMSGIVGGGEEQDSGSRYSSMLSRRTTGLDISAINTRGKQDPRTLCEPSDAFSGGIGSQSTRGYQQQTGGSGRNKRKSRFNLGKLAGDVIVNSLLGGFTSTMYYGAGRAVGAVSDGVRGRRNSRQRIADSKSGSNTALTVYDPEFAARQMLVGGETSENLLRNIVPKGTSNTFVPTATIKDGYKYNFSINGKSLKQISRGQPRKKGIANKPPI